MTVYVKVLWGMVQGIFADLSRTIQGAIYLSIKVPQALSLSRTQLGRLFIVLCSTSPLSPSIKDILYGGIIVNCKQ